MRSRPLFFLLLWYIFSGLTLFLNKFILGSLKGDPTLLGTTQMSMTLALGAFQLYFPLGMFKPMHRSSLPPNFYGQMVLVGTMRFLTVLLGLLALAYVPVSFTETIKSSAPLFTVLIARLVMGERTSLVTNLSLIPVMIGLALCSWNEILFDFGGFAAAVAANFTECLQNVYSKVLLSGPTRYSPAELQFYTSIASTFVQIPVAYFLIDSIDSRVVPFYILNGVFFHFQSISAYVLMDFISPVTHSVANTFKRALLILLSIYLFGNEISLLSSVGMLTLFVGLVLYNQSVVIILGDKDVENNKKTIVQLY